MVDQPTPEPVTQTYGPPHRGGVGRRKLMSELRARYRWITWDRMSPMTMVSMASRKERRRLQGKNFKPVYGYVGPSKLNLQPYE